MRWNSNCTLFCPGELHESTHDFLGTFAVQLARHIGAYVAVTASVGHAGLLESLGANQVIDYRAAPFERVLEPVDVILDTLGGDTRARSWTVLKKGGVLVSIAGPITKGEASAHGARGVFFIVKPDREQLLRIRALIDGGSLRVVVGRVLPLACGAEAFDYGAEHHSTGKTVLQVIGP